MKDTTQNLKHFQAQLKAVLSKKVVLGAVGNHLQAKMTNSELILIHEFGSKKQNIPARAPIRKTFNSSTVAKRLSTNFFMSLMTLAENGEDLQPALELVGQSMILETQKTINEGLTPPLSEDYLRKKIAAGYSELPLVKTEQLINSFAYEVR